MRMRRVRSPISSGEGSQVWRTSDALFASAKSRRADSGPVSNTRTYLSDQRVNQYLTGDRKGHPEDRRFACTQFCGPLSLAIEKNQSYSPVRYEHQKGAMPQGISEICRG